MGEQPTFSKKYNTKRHPAQEWPGLNKRTEALRRLKAFFLLYHAPIKNLISPPELQGQVGHGIPGVRISELEPCVK